jgi:hypothetical protein
MPAHSADITWAPAASVFVQSAVKRVLIATAPPARKKNAPAVGRKCCVKALTTISYSWRNRQRNSTNHRNLPNKDFASVLHIERTMPVRPHGET